MDLVQNLLIKIKKLSMDLVHDRGCIDSVHESGPWTLSKEGVHGPLVHVLSSPMPDKCPAGMGTLGID